MAALTKKVRFYRNTSILLLILIIAVSVVITRHIIANTQTDINSLKIDSEAPYAKDVANIIKPLRYSGLQDILRPEVRISLDFQNQQWTLHNIHRFDDGGKLILAENRYGVCEDLAVYTFQQIRPLFDPSYRIDYVMAREAGYFNGVGQHIILRIRNESGSSPENGLYLLDPSFHRYGPLKFFENYQPVKMVPSLGFEKTKQNHKVFNINGGTPVIVNKKAMLLLAVNSINDKFGPNHFRLVLNGIKRFSYANVALFQIIRENGKVQMVEDDEYDLRALFHPNDYQQLKNRAIELFENLIQELDQSDVNGHTPPNES